MPLRGQTDPEGWIASDQLRLPPQPLGAKLAEEDIKNFLHSVFADIACKPQVLRLRDTAAVVRYLRTLAAIGVPRAVSQRTNEIAYASRWALAHADPEQNPMLRHRLAPAVAALAVGLAAPAAVARVMRSMLSRSARWSQ